MLVTLNIILSADADIGRGSRVRIKTLRMRILLCLSVQGSTHDPLMGCDLQFEKQWSRMLPLYHSVKFDGMDITYK
jgi:hypothetical protein